ncbi:MAG: DNA replication/repair protein RecF [Clostridia bacterium]|nr:DNA replication/repair protein RecF [Clostridia bacterium]
MRVTNIKLNSFRNYDMLDANFFDGTNLISGGNGQGKTNLVEAVMLAALTKSPRTSNDDDMKKDGTDFTSVELKVQREFGEVDIKCTLGELGKKFYINGNEVKKDSEVFGNLVAVYFSPNDLVIVSGSPSERRDFVDTDISQLSGKYYNLIQRYQKVLVQRNKFLKTTRDKDVIYSQIEIWDEQLASLAGIIIKTRKSFIEKLKEPANEIIKFISKGGDELAIKYEGAKGTGADEIKAEILKSLKFNLERDIELGYTTIGPHRDDIIFELNGKDSKVFASQGQQRTIVLALKIAELLVFGKEIGEKPVLVLDDVFSELDTSRQRKLYERLKGYQVLMTGTNFKFKPSEDYFQIVVKSAKIKEKYVKNTK